MENVWEYPRPPALVTCERPVTVVVEGVVIARSEEALRILETSHPPTIYIPPADVRLDLLRQSSARATVCEFKGVARYWDAEIDGRRHRQIAWSYEDPIEPYEPLRNHLAFYPGRVDQAWLGDERVRAQESDFYGGWITADILGPFKGPVGTGSW